MVLLIFARCFVLALAVALCRNSSPAWFASSSDCPTTPDSQHFFGRDGARTKRVPQSIRLTPPQPDYTDCQGLK
jgi:hypothetical protein